MANGSGIVFMPVQVGLKGLWVFLIAIALSYPAVYHLQILFLRTLMQSLVCEEYAGAISHYLGKNWGIALAFVFFVMLFGAIVMRHRSRTTARLTCKPSTSRTMHYPAAAGTASP
jgi:amino acid permease